MSEKFVNRCCYIMGGLQCENGILYHVSTGDMALLEGTSIQCPTCDGRGYSLTPLGKEFITFLQTEGRPFIYGLVTEILEDKLR